MMYWICLSQQEIDVLLSLLTQERGIDYDEEEHGPYQSFALTQKYIQEAYEKLLFAVEHDV